MYYERKWEQVIEGYVYRLKTPGGWLVSSDEEGLCYIPDPGHDWAFEPKEEEIKCTFYVAGKSCSGPADDSSKALCRQCPCYRRKEEEGG